MITDAELSARLQFAMEQGSVMEFYVEPLRELQQLRAAKRADQERVRRVVRDVILAHPHVAVWPDAATDIAARVASQMASAAPAQLTSDEVAQLRHRLKDWRVTYETSALLVERLLDGASTAPVLSEDDLDALAYASVALSISQPAVSTLGDALASRHANRLNKAVAVIERLLGASR